MKRCPQCNRFGVEYDPSIKREKCLYIDCSWINVDNKNIDEENGSSVKNYSKFAKNLCVKKDIVVKLS